MQADEFRATWVANKAVYRTRMAIADGGELLIVAPGVERFGEQPEVDALIRKYGYRGTDRTLRLYKTEADMQEIPHGVAHLIHGSSEGRFTIAYAPGHLTREEIESVGYRYADLAEAQKRYDPAVMKEGWNTMPDGEEVFYVSTPVNKGEVEQLRPPRPGAWLIFVPHRLSPDLLSRFDWHIYYFYEIFGQIDESSESRPPRFSPNSRCYRYRGSCPRRAAVGRARRGRGSSAVRLRSAGHAGDDADPQPGQDRLSCWHIRPRRAERARKGQQRSGRRADRGEGSRTRRELLRYLGHLWRAGALERTVSWQGPEGTSRSGLYRQQDEGAHSRRRAPQSRGISEAVEYRPSRHLATA